jgi:hypothetical protein
LIQFLFETLNSFINQKDKTIMSDLLKQAIADAKAVRATALANAKAALEEAFAPKLQSMLGEKLRQEVEGDSEEVAPAAPAPEALDAAAPAPAAEAPAPAPEADMAMEADEEEMEEVRGTINVTSAPDGAVNSEIQAGTFVNETEKASDDYKKVTKGHHTEDPQGQGKELADGPSKDEKNATAGEPKAAADSHKASDDYKKTTSGHKTQDPQGASNEVVKLSEEEIDESSLEEILKELEDSVNEVGGMEEMAANMEAAAPEAKEEVDEEINLDELLSEGKDEEEKKEEKDEVDEGKLPPGLAKYQKEKAEKEEKHDDDKKEKTDESIVKENLSLKKEIEEYRSGIEFLRDRINEINLLNAKLLYTNKLFKSSNLTNEQKLKVIESFDLTKSVREAKIVYATLAESFNFGAKKAAEPVKASATVKTITEGLASKAVASTKPSKPAVIAEGADMANRFKKLAGIR